jgi:hypothetical protein
MQLLLAAAVAAEEAAAVVATPVAAVVQVPVVHLEQLLWDGLMFLLLAQ